MKFGDKLYFVTHNELSTGQKFAQLIHAFRQFIKDHGEIELDWFETSNFVCVLAVDNKDDLNDLFERAINHDIKTSAFYEPDFKDELTAIVLEPGNMTAKLCKGIDLLC